MVRMRRRAANEFLGLIDEKGILLLKSYGK
jgi:hypothetical protein